jgi:hypothetical protein
MYPLNQGRQTNAEDFSNVAAELSFAGKILQSSLTTPPACRYTKWYLLPNPRSTSPCQGIA